jgi:23S rRNA (uracil1939-C5)-methyltransferase
MAVKRGKELELRIETLAFGGRGIARQDGYVLFVDGAIPGQRVKARVTRKKRDYAEAVAFEVIEDSDLAVPPVCPHFGICGGCRLQNLDYQAQLRYKREQVIDSLKRIAGLPEPPVAEIVPSEDTLFYRNKMEFSFGRRRWITKEEVDAGTLKEPRDFALGLHVRGRYDRVLNIETCFLQSELTAEIVREARRLTFESGLPAYSTFDHTGFWRFLVLREGKNTGELMVNVVTAEEPQHYPTVKKLAQDLRARFPEITTIVHTVNKTKAQVAIGDEQEVLWGPGFIQERLGKYFFRISANSFFQTNTKGAERLFDVVMQFADFKGSETVFDLYSGAGTISIYVAGSVQKVVGFEVVPAAIQDAVINCALNAVRNCHFVEGDLKDELAQVPVIVARWGSPDVIIIDPPRAGMHPKVVQRLLQLSAEKIIYVSCNPATFARDIKDLIAGGYQLRQVQPVDMFPHTSHIEVVSLLTRA